MPTETTHQPGYLLLHAGPLTVEYDPVLGDLRYLRWGDKEIVRRLYAALRGPNWATIPATITETERTIGADSFRIVYTARHQSDPIDFRWQGTLIGTPDGTITFDFDGEARNTFTRNRIGICVLHPAELAGMPCTLTHTDATERNTAFPQRISPHQPFLDLAALSYEVEPDVVAAIRFAGDIFETEDQRNWLDASFKTYSTPLALPMPAEVPVGTRIHQTVTVTLSNPEATPLPAAENGPISCTATLTPVQHRNAPLDPPRFGLCLPPSGEIPETLHSAVRALALDYLYLDVDFATPGSEEALVRADTLARGIAGSKLFVGVRNVNQMSETFPRFTTDVTYFLQDPNQEDFHRIAKAAYDASGSYPTPRVSPPQLGRGTHANFTELNRNPHVGFPNALIRPATAFAGNPQVHAFDDASIMETPYIVAEALFCARRISQTSRTGVGPLTFYGRHQRDDPRQRAPIAAAWYAAAALHATFAGAAFLTLCEIVGPRGIMDESGNLYPVYHALAALLPLLRGNRFFGRASDPLKVAFLPVKANELFTAIAVNLTPLPQDIALYGFPNRKASLRLLISEGRETRLTAPEIVSSQSDGTFPQTLPPYAILIAEAA